jgi:3-mercaptopyruvate sulfurtransferase SseA
MKYPAKAFALWFAVMAAPFVDSEVARADPSKYPQYAQQTLPADVKPEFIKVELLVNDIINRKTPLIIDVRSVEEYQEVHIKGAVSIPLAEFESRVKEIPRDRPVVLY